MTKEQLLKELEAKKKAFKEQAKEQYEVAVLTAELNTIGTEAFAKREQYALLNDRLKELEAIVEATVGKLQFHQGLSRYANKIVGLLKSAYFSKIEDRELALSAINISEDLAEDIIDNAGNLAYYSKNNHVVINGVESSFEALEPLIKEASISLGLNPELIETGTLEQWKVLNSKALERAQKRFDDQEAFDLED